MGDLPRASLGCTTPSVRGGRQATPSKTNDAATTPDVQPCARNTGQLVGERPDLDTLSAPRGGPSTPAVQVDVTVFKT